MVNGIRPNVSALLKFLDSGPSPFHVVEECRKSLEVAGFQRLFENASWQLEPNRKYFFTRNGSSLVAFTIGGQFNPNLGAINIIAAHTDSPCLKVKPISKRRTKDGFLQVAIETYGGGLWHTWFDRDLGLAGRVITLNSDGKLKEKLVQIDRPILRIPTLAIHLDRGVNNDGFKFNTELQLVPILSTESTNSKDGQTDVDNPIHDDNFYLHQALSEVLKENAEIDQGEIIGMDLCLFDVQKASLGGIHDEFVYSARIDNLYMTFAGITSLLNGLDSIENDTNIRMLTLFDNEEVGSLSFVGAESTLIASTINRTLASLDAVHQFESILAKSFLLSADMAHAVHPNYSDKHDECHRPKIQKGIVIKYNSNQRYATNSRSAAYIKSLAAKNNIPFQEFMVRNDSPCGSTIGPIVAAQLGLQSIDVGAAQLGMHSIREMAGVEDIDNSIRLFRAFYEISPGISSIQSLDRPN